MTRELKINLTRLGQWAGSITAIIVLCAFLVNAGDKHIKETVKKEIQQSPLAQMVFEMYAMQMASMPDSIRKQRIAKIKAESDIAKKLFQGETK